MKTRLFFTMIVMALGCLFVNAQIVHIPDEFTTIQEGIDAAGDGDTVLVADGTYNEQINFKGKAITVASQFIIDGDTSHINNTVIDGNLGIPGDTSSAVRFVSGEDSTSVLIGFTIEGGKGILTPYYFGETRIGGGIACIGSTAKIVHNRIINNSTTHEFYALGGGIGCYTEDDTQWLVVENNYIANNECHATGDSDWRSAGGGGMYAYANAKVNNNEVYHNECHSTHQSDGAGLEFESSGDPNIFTIYCSGNTIHYNWANGVSRGVGGGISNSCNIYLTNNMISDNTITGATLTAGGGVFMSGFEDASEIAMVKNNEFIGNISEGAGSSLGSAFCMWRTGFDTTSFKNNIVSDNSFEGGASKFSAFYIYNTAPLGTLPQSRVEIESNLFTNNVADYGGGLNVSNVLNMNIVNNVFADNEGIYGGAVALTNSSGLEETHTPVVANNTFMDNMASTGGGAISNALRVSLVTFNNIFWNDESPDGNELQSFFDSTMVVNNSLINEDDISGSWEGTNNFYDNPQFMEDDFHILPGSPCVNTGVESFVFKEMEYHSPPEDIDGEGRPMYEGVDVGADEMFVVGYEEKVIEPVNRYEVAVYPNPAKNFAILDSEYSIDEITIYNMAGQILYSGTYHQKKVELDLSNINEGMLVIRVLTDGAYSTHKILKH